MHYENVEKYMDNQNDHESTLSKSAQYNRLNIMQIVLKV